MCRLPQGQQEIQQRKILYMGLYLLIWGEAANVRFMPECLCYIFHNVSTGSTSMCFFLFYEFLFEIDFFSFTINHITNRFEYVWSDGIWTPWPIGWKCQHCYWWKHKAFLWWWWRGLSAKGYNTPLPCYRKGMVQPKHGQGHQTSVSIGVLRVLVSFFCSWYSRRQTRAETGKLLTRLGAIMMIWTSISGMMEFLSNSEQRFYLSVVILSWFSHLIILYLFSGHLIAFLSAGQCAMMVIFSNQLVIWRYLCVLSSVILIFFPTPFISYLINILALSGKKGFSKKIRKHRKILLCWNPNILEHL